MRRAGAAPAKNANWSFKSMFIRLFMRALMVAAVCTCLAALASNARARPKPKPRPAAPPSLDEVVRQQAAMLKRLQTTVDEQGRRLEAQGAELKQLREQLEAVKAAPTAPATSPVVATASTAAPAGPTASTAEAVAVAEQDAAAAPAPAADKEPNPDWFQRIKVEGELRFRTETTFNRGLDQEEDKPLRQRFYYRLRVRITEKLDEHADWGLYLTSGDVETGSDSQNQTLTGEFSRKPIGIQAAFLHYTTATDPVNFEVKVGKYLFPWELPQVSFSDNNLAAEGLTENATFAIPGKSKLKSVGLMAWQLPFVERGLYPDAYVYGGQIESDWQWSKNWSTTIWNALFDFSNFPDPNQPDETNVFVPGPSFLTTQIAETRYEGWGEKNDEGTSRWEVKLRPEFLYRPANASGGKFGYTFQSTLGRIDEPGDWLFDNFIYRNDENVLPDFFTAGSGIGTNAIGDEFATSYRFTHQIWVRARYDIARKLVRTGPENRLYNRFQFDVRYEF
jgi:hypothetical protein